MNDFTKVQFLHPRQENFVSVIIPVDADHSGLKATIESLTKQTAANFGYEILVGNDGGQPEITRYCNDQGIFCWSTKVKIGSYAMRNQLIERSRGEVLAFIDAQTLALPHWLKLGVERIKKDAYVGGRVTVVPDPDHPISSHLLTYQQLLTFDVAQYMSLYHFASTTNLFVRRSVIEKCGGFDARLFSSGDLEFGSRITGLGMDVFYDDTLEVHHFTRTLKALIRKQRRIAFGHYDLYRLYPERFGRFHFSLVQTILKMLLPPIWILKKQRVFRLSLREKMFVFMLATLFYVAYHFFGLQARWQWSRRNDRAHEQ